MPPIGDFRSDASWQSILAAPDDEDLKSRFARALRKAGDPRAEAFRLAKALRQFPPYYVQHESLAKQYESSLDIWHEDFTPFAARWTAQLDFVDGWPSQITIAASAFLRCAEEIVATIPLRHLNLTGIADAPKAVEVAPLAQIASLQVSSQPWSCEAIQALADSEQLRSLRWLDLSEGNLTDTDVEILASSTQLRNVAYINLEGNPCRNPIDASEGYGVDGFTGLIVAESIWFPAFGRGLEARYGTIPWLHSLATFLETYPSRYRF